MCGRNLAVMLILAFPITKPKETSVGLLERATGIQTGIQENQMVKVQEKTMRCFTINLMMEHGTMEISMAQQ